MDEDKIIIDIEVNGDADVDKATKSMSKLGEEQKKVNKNSKDNSDQINKTKESFTQFSSAIEAIVPGFGKLTGGIDGATKASLKFIATPIGAILAAIVLTLAAVSAWFTSTEEGGDMLAKRFAQLSAIGQVLFDRFVAIGGALVKLFTGDLIGAANDFEAAITGIGDEMEREVGIAGQLADMLDALEDRERAYGVSASVTTNEIKQLILASRNRLLSEREKIDLLQEAFDKEVKQNETLKRIRQDQLSVAIQQIQTTTEGAKVQQKYGETFLQYAERLVNAEKIQGAERDKVAKALIAYNQVEGESLALREKLTNQIDAQADKERDRIQRIKDEAAALLDKAIKQDQADSKELARSEIRNANIQDAANKEAEADRLAKAAKSINRANDSIEEQLAIDRRVIANQEAIDKVVALEQAASEKIKQMRLQAVGAAIGFAGSIVSKTGEIRRKDYEQQLAAVKGNTEAELQVKKAAFEADKKNQIAQALIGTAQGALNAFQALSIIPFVGPILGAAAAAAAVIFGLKQVQQIRAQQFVAAEGGNVPRWQTIGGRLHSQGGTNFYGDDGTRFQAEKDEGLFILKRGAHDEFLREQSGRNQKYGGRSWGRGPVRYAEQGGYVGSASSNNAPDINQLANVVVAAVAAMPRPVVYVGDINAAQNDVEVIQDAATL